MLWIRWVGKILKLRPAFTRMRTFQWFVVTLAAMTVRKDIMGGVTSFIRSGNIKPKKYKCILNSYKSSAVDLPRLNRLWNSLVREIFSEHLFLINGKMTLVGDGIKIGKEGKRMPGVKLLHQSSESNSKSEWIMGHSLQALSLLVQSSDRTVSVPLGCNIHEGVRSGPRDKNTLLTKMSKMILDSEILKEDGAYFIADNYYCSGEFAKTLEEQGIFLISRVRKNAVAYEDPGPYSGAGRPRKYGKKVKLWSLFSKLKDTMEVTTDDGSYNVKYGVYDLIWKSYGKKVRFCLVDDPKKGKIILVSVDKSLTANDILKAYSNRFKIEYSFKELVHDVGGFAYRFWTASMKKTKKNSGDLYLHRKTSEEKKKILSTISSYHFYIQTALISQGLSQFLALKYDKEVQSKANQWLRTRRPGVPASVQTTQEAMRNEFEFFQKALPNNYEWRTFIKDAMENPYPPENQSLDTA